MDRVTREAIELDEVLERLAGEASCSLGSNYVRELQTSNDLGVVRERLDRVGEIISLFEANKRLPLGQLEDLTELFDRASLEGSALAPEDWPRLRRAMHAAAELTAFAERGATELPRLAALCSGLCANANLLRSIDRIFDPDGLIRDNASPELSRLRAAIRRSEAQLKTILNRVLESLRGRSVLQDEYSTIRNGRHVFPVRAGSRGRVPGIVHGSSASGETLYVEPMQVVEATNELELERTLEAAEVQRIMRELTAELRPWIPEARKNQEIFSVLDGVNALARNAYNRGWKIPVVAQSGALRLYDAHHPLLHLTRPTTSIPITMVLDAGDKTIVVSGPNAGGKTTLMKTIALHAALLQCGSPVPASPDSRFPLFAGFYADIGDQQSLGEGISTFSGHMRRLREILDAADAESLVLLDELGTGTDPEEGGALAQVLLEEFSSRAALTLATSHLGPVKKWAEDAPYARNASFSLDATTHRPTYRLRLDLPGPSEAFYIAENEGLPVWLLDRARSLVGEQKLMMGELLRRIEERERALGETLREAKARAESLEAQEALARRRADELREERRRARQSLLEERERAVREARERFEKLIAELPSEEQLRQRREALTEARRDAAARQMQIANEKRDIEKQEVIAVKPRELRAGAKVYVRAMNGWGEIVRVSPDGKRATVQVGPIAVESAIEGLSRTAPDALERLREPKIEEPEGKKEKKKKKQSRKMKAAMREIASMPEESSRGPRQQASAGGVRYSPPESVPLDLDLHGFRVEEALAALDKYLDRAILADYSYVRIVHGTGEGKLYRAVHNFLRTYRAAKSFRFGTPDEGGGGVTIVELA